MICYNTGALPNAGGLMDQDFMFAICLPMVIDAIEEKKEQNMNETNEEIERKAKSARSR